MEQKLSKAFTIEAAKREIFACNDLDKLRHLAYNLMQQTEMLKEMVGSLLVSDF